MTAIAQFALLLAIAVFLVALSIVAAILMMISLLSHGKRLSGWAWETFWVASGTLFIEGLMVSALAAYLTDEPSAYTRQVGLPQMVRIERLDFLSGTFGHSSVVRVDTDHGIYYLDGYTPIPRAGTIYAVERRKFWGTDTHEFLCPNASLIQCWPVLTNLG